MFKKRPEKEGISSVKGISLVILVRMKRLICKWKLLMLHPSDLWVTMGVKMWGVSNLVDLSFN